MESASGNLGLNAFPGTNIPKEESGYSAVVGSIIVETSLTLLAGNPPSLA